MRARIILPILILTMLTVAQTAMAGSYVYSQGRRVIKACVLLLPDAGSTGFLARDYNAGIIQVLDKRADLKPGGWDFINPLAPPRVTSAIQNRYAGFIPLTLNARITKDDLAYWDVKLDEVTLSRLLQFDLVYLPIPRNAAAVITPKQREMLRKLADSGAQIWVDWGGGGSAPFGTGPCAGQFFIPSTNFQAASRGPGYVYNRHHPLLSYPYWLIQQEVNLLGIDTASGVCSDGAGGMPFPSVFSGVVRNGGSSGLPFVAAGPYGSGHVILTANNVGADIVRGYYAGGVNPAYAAPEDLKFAYNVVAWGANYTTTFKDPAHSSAAAFGPGAPLVQRWQYPEGGPEGTAAVVYKGVVFFTTAGGDVCAFDSIPGQDLDNDGNPDDGIPDFGLGAPYDMIWKVSLGSCSGPTIVSWPGGSGPPAGSDVVLVTKADGAVVAFEAFPSPLGTTPTPTSIFAVSGAYTDYIPSPTYHNGVIYTVGATDGYLYCYSIYDNEQWKIPGNPGASYAILPRTYPPAVGWIQDIGSSANDLMTYWIGGTNASPNDNDRIFSAIMEVRNEPLKTKSAEIRSTRYFSNRSITAPWSVWAITGGGSGCVPLGSDASTVSVNVDAAIMGQFVLASSAFSGSVAASTPMYADYRMMRQFDPMRAMQNTGPRTIIVPKPQAFVGTPLLETAGPLSLGPDGELYMVGHRMGTNGESSQIVAMNEYGPHFYGIPTEQATPLSKVNWTVWLDRMVTDPANPDYSFPGVDYSLEMTDPVVSGSGAVPGRPLGRFVAAAPVAVTQDTVYVTAKGKDVTDGSDVVALFAFDRNHKYQVIIDPSVNMREADGHPFPVRIWQPNPIVSTSVVSALMDSARVPGQLVDYDRRTITIDNFDEGSLQMSTGASGGTMPSPRPIFACLPVTVFVGDVEAKCIPKLNNLRWYFIAYAPETIAETGDPNVPPKLSVSNRAQGAPSPPVVMGEYVYFGTGDGHIYAVRTDATPQKGKQVFGLAPNYARTTVEALQAWERSNTSVAWQDKISSGELTRPISGAGGVLAAVSSTGLAVYDSPTTLIVDNNRILEVDGGSGAVWSVDATIEQKAHADDSANLTGVSARKKPFSRPSCARYTEGNNILVCDSGNNRVVVMDKGGNVSLEIRDFKDPLNLLTSGEPLRLNGPSDVRTWALVEDDPVFPGTKAYIYHYLVADRDNYRILDLITRFDANGQPLSIDPDNMLLAPGEKPPVVLNWVSSSRAEGRMLRYETAQMFPINATDVVVLAAVSNYAPQNPSDDPQMKDPPGGSLVGISYATVGSGKWNYARPAKILNSTVQLTGGVRLSNPKFYERVWVGPNPGDFHDIVCDSSGVYELDQNGAIIWKLTSEVYMNNLPQITSGGLITSRGVPLRASSAKILPSGRMLITNEFTGRGSGGNEFRGEVFEVDRKDASGNFLTQPSGIFWSAPAITAGTPLITEIQGSYVIDQPTFADRR